MVVYARNRASDLQSFRKFLRALAKGAISIDWIIHLDIIRVNSYYANYNNVI